MGSGRAKRGMPERAGSISGWTGGVAAAAIAFALAAAYGHALAQAPDLDRGRMLYENHCRGCHTSQVHHRVPRVPIDRAELQRIVRKWAVEENLPWTDEEIADVVRYLGVAVYQF